MTTANLTFVRANCTACGNDDVWLTCNQCSERHHFLRHDDHVACDCGATYTSAQCTCGASVAFDSLVAVPFEDGPVRLDDFEVAWDRLAILGAAVLGLGAVGWWLFT